MLILYKNMYLKLVGAVFVVLSFSCMYTLLCILKFNPMQFFFHFPMQFCCMWDAVLHYVRCSYFFILDLCNFFTTLCSSALYEMQFMVYQSHNPMSRVPFCPILYTFFMYQVIFPVLQSVHYYVVCFNFAAKQIHIMDHDNVGKSITDKYGIVPLNLVCILNIKRLCSFTSSNIIFY